MTDFSVDTAIIGAGVVGLAIANELSKQKKEVLVIDLNPLSRSSRGGTVGIVDEVTRVAKNLIQMIPEKPPVTDWDNNKSLQSALDHITTSMSNKFE